VASVSAFLTVEIHRGVGAFAICGWLLVVIEAAEALLSCPCLQQSSIHGEVLIRKQIVPACLLEYGCEEGVGDLACKQTLAVFC